MTRLELSFAFAENPRTRRILSGAIIPEGIDLIPSRVGMPELAWRQLGYKEFQVSELPISSLLISRSHGDETWIGLPVFASRHFYHTWILVREDANLEEPGQLAGKRIGVPDYQQTPPLWARGVLQHEFGVDLTSCHWFMEHPPERGHGGATEFQLPPGIKLSYIPAEKSIGRMLRSGELDAALLYLGTPNLANRARAGFGPGSGVKPLFPDARAEGTRYLSKTGIIPMNHTAVVRKDVVERYPWAVLNLYKAFLESRGAASSETQREFDSVVDASNLKHPTAKAFAADPFPYGIVANQNALEAALVYSYEQGLSSRRMAIDEIYYAPTLEL